MKREEHHLCGNFLGICFSKINCKVSEFFCLPTLVSPGPSSFWPEICVVTLVHYFMMNLRSEYEMRHILPLTSLHDSGVRSAHEVSNSEDPISTLSL